MTDVRHLQELKEGIQNRQMVLGYFSTPTCNVCKVLKPKIKELLKQNFQKVHFFYVDIETVPEAQGEYMVFAVPTIIVFVEGKEIKRFSRHIGVGEVEDILNRYYDILFG
jgi:thioredoxin-like negative regulator of GroEL